MAQDQHIRMDQLDLKILRELEVDGRLSVSDLSKKLGISRAYAGKKLQRLLERQITRIASFTNPLALGYQTYAIIGIQVSPKEVHTTADRLSALKNVHLVTIVAGRYEILIQALLRIPGDLPVFLQRELGKISTIISFETNIVLQTRKMSYSYLGISYVGTAIFQQEGNPTSILQHVKDREADVDELDLMILRELEADGRQSVSNLARKLSINRVHAAARLQRLLDKHMTRIVAFTNPLLLGYNTFAMIGLKVSPNEIHVAADKLSALKNVYWVVMVAGRHDIIIWTMFPTPIDLSRFLGSELGSIPGITSIEITVGLELRKMSFHRLVSSDYRANDG